jgi:ABC-2 type transport system permease protein
MPGVVRVFVEKQPMTPLIESVRSLMLNEPTGNSAATAAIWCVAILIVAYIGSMQIYKRRAA